MDIRLISSMTAEDEARIAPALIHFVSTVLDSLPVAYTLRVQTADGTTFQRSHPTLRLANITGEELPPG